MKLPPMRNRSLQQGYILISTIIIVLLITLLALAGVSYNSTQTRIASNSKDGQIAFETADAVLRQVVNIVVSSDYLQSGSVCNSSGTGAGAKFLNVTCEGTGGTADLTPLWQTANPPWQTTLPSGTATYKGNSYQAGAYIVEGLANVTAPKSGLNATSQVKPYRITVEAWGGVTGTAPQVMLQSIVLGATAALN